MKFFHSGPTLQKYFCPTPGYKCRSRQIFGRANDFYPKSAKLARKFGMTFAQEYLEFLDIPAFAKKFSPIMNPFWCDLRKKDSCVFLPTLGTIFWSQTTLRAIFALIFRDFQRIFRDFPRISTNQKIWGYTFTPCTTASYTTLPATSTFDPCLEKILLALMFRGTGSSTEMLKGCMARESLGTPDLGPLSPRNKVCLLSLTTKALIRNHTKSTLVERIT